jgi:sigma-B regulation protein RsbU (phosphoserine phosphatase)
MSISLPMMDMDSGSNHAVWTRWLLAAGEGNFAGFIKATVALLKETYHADHVGYLPLAGEDLRLSLDAPMRTRRFPHDNDPLIVRFSHSSAMLVEFIVERRSPSFSEEERRIASTFERLSSGLFVAPNRAESAESQEEARILREFALLSSSLDLVRIQCEVAEKFSEIAGARRCVLFLFHPNREALKPEAQRDAVGIQLSDHDGPLFPLPSADSLHTALLTERLLETPVPELFSQTLKDLIAYMGEPNLALLPLVHYGSLTGVLAWTKGPGAPPISECCRNMYSLIARQIASAIQNARSYEESERRIQELSSLQRISQGLVSNLHLKQMLEQAVAEIVASMEADSGSILFYDSRTRMMRVEASVGTASISRKPYVELGEGVAGWMAIHREAVLLEDLKDDPRFKLLADRPEIKSSMVAPILVQRRLLGALCIASHSASRRFNERDLGLTQTMAATLAVAIENARHYEDERQIAQIARDALLPRLPLVIPGLDIGEKHAPSHEVGGDCYHLYDLGDDKVGILVSDVSGKSIPAAMHAAMGKHFIRALTYRCDDPAEAMTYANLLVAQDTPPEIFITVFYGILNVATGDLVYCNAGHVPPFLAREDRSVVELNQTGVVIGLWDGLTYENARVTLNPGDTLLCYTDGVTEARRDGDLFGYDRLKSALLKHHDKSAQRIVDLIYRRTLAFCGKKTDDDLALLALKRTSTGDGWRSAI